MFQLKKILISFLILSVVAFSNLCSIGIWNDSTVFAVPYTDYMVTEDSYIQNGASVNTNFGNETELITKDDDDATGFDRRGFMKVNFAGFSGASVTSAKLFVYCTTYINNGTSTLAGFTDDSWNENTITWNNLPSNGGLSDLDTKTVVGTGWYSFDVTNFINGQMSDKVASFKLYNQYGVNWYKFSSSEAAENKPYLKLTTAAATTNYTMAKDAYIQGGTNANTNYGATTNFIVRNSADPNYIRIGYMTADFNSFDAYNVESAKLNFYVNSIQNPGQIMVYGLMDDNWTESGTNSITWNNRPGDDGNAVIITSKKITATGWNIIDLTEFVNTQMAAGDKKATFKFATTFDCGPYDIASKNAASNKPFLELTGNRAGVQAKDARAFVDSMGVNTHLTVQGSKYDTTFSTATTGIKARIDELGVRHIRDCVTSTTNPQDFKTTVWGRMNQLAGLSGQPVKFTITTYLSSFADPNRIAADYAGAGSTWEAVAGLNEPDHAYGVLQGDPNWPMYAYQQQQALWNWVQTYQPSLPVVGPVPASWQNYDEIAAAGSNISDYMNYGDIHAYYGGSKPVTHNTTGGSTGLFAHSVAASKDVSGTKPFMITETGWHTATGVDPIDWMQETDPTVMAKHLTRGFFYYWNLGSMRTFIYELLDQGISSTDPQMRFGLLNNDGSVKPAFTAMKNMITVLDDSNTAFTPGKLEFQVGGNTQYVKYSLLQKRNKKYYLALWLEKPVDTTAAGVSQSITLTFNNETINTVKSCRIKDTTTFSTVSTRPAPGAPIDITLYDDVVLFEITK